MQLLHLKRLTERVFLKGYRYDNSTYISTSNAMRGVVIVRTGA
jgi:hypothetical protein